MELTPKEKKVLLNLARTTIEVRSTGGNPPGLPAETPLLNERRGAFVTLKKRGKLWGCIGYTETVKPLAMTIEEMALAATFHDSRFPTAEMGGTEVPDHRDMRPLPLKRNSGYSTIETGVRHGLYAVRGFHRGMLLQVASEHCWDRLTFLAEICYMNCVPPKTWQEKGTRV